MACVWGGEGGRVWTRQSQPKSLRKRRVHGSISAFTAASRDGVFALVDRVLEHEPGKRAVAIKNVTLNEPQFQGHFPGRPLMPGVLIVEAMAQVGGLIVTQMPDLPKGLFVFAGIDGVRFRRPVVPGDQLRISCELLSLKRQRFGKVHAEVTVDGELVCSGDLMFSLVD